MKAKWILTLIAATTTAFGVAMAEGMDQDSSPIGAEGSRTLPRSQAQLQALDRDGDRMISSDEAMADPELSDRFDEYDRNDDDLLDEGEFARFDEGATSSGDDPNLAEERELLDDTSER